MTVVAACLAFNISRRCYYRWRPRWQAGRQAGLVDRSSRPLTSPQRLSAETERLIAGLRITTGWDLEVFHSAEQRWRGLAAWIDHYNRERPHLALNGSPPLVRLQQLMTTS